MCKISVLLPAYNAEKYIRQCIESILNQNFKDFELLIFNDGSTDNTLGIIQSFKDIRIRLFNYTSNRGYLVRLNEGIEKARGNYIARVDSDDFIDENRFSKQYDYLDKHPEYVAVGTFTHLVDENNNFGEKIEWAKNDLEAIYFFTICRSPIPHPSVMFRKEPVLNLGNYRAKYYPAEDVELWFRLIRNGLKCSNLNEYLTYYRVHNSQISTQKRQTQENNHKLAFVDGLLGENGSEDLRRELFYYMDTIYYGNKPVIFDNLFIVLKTYNKILRILNLKKDLKSQLKRRFWQDFVLHELRFKKLKDVAYFLITTPTFIFLYPQITTVFINRIRLKLHG